jgi:hypothetical protein
MDWIERLFLVYPDAADGSFELLYLLLPLTAVFIGFWWFWHSRKTMELAKRPVVAPITHLSPDDLGIPDLEVGRMNVEGDESNIAFAFDIDLMTRLKLAAEKRKTTPGNLMAQAVVRAMENPAILSKIEMQYVRRRRTK